ncbi:hypothetical protein AB836_00885 [Rickettsiales bacterium (ex Bugula neritina AB1)]|nr:hypothetical protein AB836_00885 [Rickettsiales bacterium (ex Bugula neritina AB1)]
MLSSIKTITIYLIFILEICFLNIYFNNLQKKLKNHKNYKYFIFNIYIGNKSKYSLVINNKNYCFVTLYNIQYDPIKKENVYNVSYIYDVISNK